MASSRTRAAEGITGIRAERVGRTETWGMGAPRCREVIQERTCRRGLAGEELAPGSLQQSRPSRIFSDTGSPRAAPTNRDFFGTRLRFACGREKFRAVDVSPLTLEQLTQDVRDVALQVHAAQERLEDRDFIAAVHQAVDLMGRRFRDLLSSLPPGEQVAAERALGRRVADVRRLASLLPRTPANLVVSTPDRQVSGSSTVGERRITGVSWTHDRSAPSAGLRVGGEVEAWCGKCGEAKTHNIIAMVGSDPKQVLCQSCGSRHSYRTEPARKRPTEGIAESTSGRQPPPDREAARKMELMRALSEEVAASSTVRVFNPKERYKAGEIISHPEYGRGKIENVLRSSLLVRFPRSGLKPLSLI